MKTIDVTKISQAVAEMCITANSHLGADVKAALNQAFAEEQSPQGRGILGDILENIALAEKKDTPICQDTGMVVCFVSLGQDLQLTGGSLDEAIQAGVARGYAEGYLRSSVVADPFIRENTGDNTPAVIHYEVVSGDKLRIQLMCKGFGSENTGALKMLKPSDGITGAADFIVDTVARGAANSCAPIIVGVGVGGDLEKAAILSKKALGRTIGKHHPAPHIAALEEELLCRINNLGVGPMGLGGTTTALTVNVETFPTHIAGLPVAVNICCYVNRHVEREF